MTGVLTEIINLLTAGISGLARQVVQVLAYKLL